LKSSKRIDCKHEIAVCKPPQKQALWNEITHVKKRFQVSLNVNIKGVGNVGKKPETYLYSLFIRKLWVTLDLLFQEVDCFLLLGARASGLRAWRAMKPCKTRAKRTIEP
jgi:hypothetical protein